MMVHIQEVIALNFLHLSQEVLLILHQSEQLKLILTEVIKLQQDLVQEEVFHLFLINQVIKKKQLLLIYQLLDLNSHLQAYMIQLKELHLMFQLSETDSKLLSMVNKKVLEEPVLLHLYLPI